MRVVLPPAPGLSVAVGPLEPLPAAVTGEWLTARVLRDLPTGVSVERVEAARTALGWPATVLRARDGEQVILRVYYRFLDWGALGEARGPDELAWTVLTQARPDWSGRPAALCDIFG